METMKDFIFLGSKITSDGDCCCEIKRRLLLGRKAITNLESILRMHSTSLCIMGSSFIHLVRTDWNEFFLMAE